MISKNLDTTSEAIEQTRKKNKLPPQEAVRQHYEEIQVCLENSEGSAYLAIPHVAPTRPPYFPRLYIHYDEDKQCQRHASIRTAEEALYR
jgi:hypothetical protein